MSYLGLKPGGFSTSFDSITDLPSAQRDFITGTGASTYPLTWDPGSATNLEVTISGVTQNPSVDYTVTSGGSPTITFTTVLPTGMDALVMHRGFATGGPHYQSLINDPNPTLGADLDVNSYALRSSANGDINVLANGTGRINLDGMKWPLVDGAAGQALTTDGNGDLAFTTVSGGGGGGSQDLFKTFAVAGQANVVADNTTDTLTFSAGSNMTITTNATTDTITFASSGGGGGSQNVFDKIAVSGQSNVQADSTTDTLTFVAGSNITITTDAGTDAITINSTASGSGTVTNIATGTGLTGGPITTTGTIAVDVGTAADKIIQLDGYAKLPAVDGSQLTNLPSGTTTLTGLTDVDAVVAGDDGKVLYYDHGTTSFKWKVDDVTPAGYNNTNWDTAHGWGDHSGAGYLTSVGGLTSHTDLDAVVAGDDGKIIYYDHGTTSFKWKVDAGGPADTDALPEGTTNLYYTDARADARVTWTNLVTRAGVTGPQEINIGQEAGLTSQGAMGVAIGYRAGQTTQGAHGIGIGRSAGKTTQGEDAVAIGRITGSASQGVQAVAVGSYAGSISQGANAVAIGAHAGVASQAASSIVINATGSTLENTTASSLKIAPIRNVAGTTYLQYDATTNEVTHATLDITADRSTTIHYVNGNFGTAGDSRNSKYISRGITTDATQTEIFVGGTASARISLQNNAVMSFEVLVTATRETTFGGAGWQFVGLLENNAGVVSILGTVTKRVMGKTTAAYDVSVDETDINDALRIRVTGEASHTVRWMAVVNTVEVAQ